MAIRHNLHTMKKILLLLLISTFAFGQNPTKNVAGFYAGSSTIDASAIGQFNSTVKGFLVPRMTTTQRNAISSPATSLLIFNTTTGVYNYYNGTIWTDFGGDVPTLQQILDLSHYASRSGVNDTSFDFDLDGAFNLSVTDNISRASDFVWAKNGWGVTNNLGSYFGTFGITSGRVLIEQWNGANLTQIDIDTPTVDANIHFPAPSLTGDYYTGLSVNGVPFGSDGDVTVSTGSGTVTSVSGTTNRITVTSPTTTPVIDISSTFEALLGKVANRIDQNNASTSSSQLASVISNETGTGFVVYSDSPTLSGTPNAPTQSANDNTTKIATTAYADAKVQNSLSASTTVAPSATAVNTALATYAPLTAVSTIKKPTADVTTTIATETVVTDLTFPVAINTTYVIRGRVSVGCNNTGGVSLGTKFPTGSTLVGNGVGRAANNTSLVNVGFSTSGVLSTVYLNTVSSQAGFAFIDIVLTTGSTSGNFDLIFASGTAGQTSTLIAAGTYLEYIKL